MKSLILEKIDCFLNFESKVECKLEFQSFSKVVCQEYSKYITVSKREFLYKKSYIRRFFNEELDNLIMSEIKQNKNLGYYENILWHWIDEHKEEKPIKIVLNPQSDIRSNSSLTQNKYTRRVHSNMITNEDSPLTVPLRTASRRSTVKSTPKDMFRTSTKIELKYVQYVIVLKSLDYSYLISTSSSCYISNKEFYEKLEQKVFKNLIEKISEYSSRQMEVRDNIDGVCYLNNFPSKVKSKFKKFMKKNLKLSIFGVIILFILVIFIC